MKKILNTKNIILCALLTLFASNNIEAKLDVSGRYFKYNGQYPYFVGYDLQELFSKKAYRYADVDYKLDQLKEFRVNKVRVWANTWFMGTRAYYPWVVDSSGKKNLDVWDNTYWKRMRDFVQKCKDRQIIVEFTIFATYPKDSATWMSTDYRLAWNRKFNTNEGFSPNLQGHFWPEFYNFNFKERSSSGKTLKDYQKALIDKSIDELHGYGNVYFEVANEFPGVWANGTAINQVYSWQQYWAEYMNQTKGVIVTVHANEGSGMNRSGIEHFKDKTYASILNFHFYAATDNNIDLISIFLNDLQSKNKLLQCNESHPYEKPTYTDSVTREAWATFLSGGYYFHYQDTADLIGDRTWRSNAERLKVLRNVAESVQFFNMSAVDVGNKEYDSLVKDGPGTYWQVFANPGKEYVVYFAINPTSKPVKIDLPEGDYKYKFYDTLFWKNDGIKNGKVTSNGGITAIGVPPRLSWEGNTGLVLVIKKPNRTNKIK